MEAPSVFKRNFLAIIPLILVILGMVFKLAPSANLKEWELSCSKADKIIFNDRQACTDHPKYRAGGCSCGPKENPNYVAYHFIVVPFVVALLGYVLLTGSLTNRIILVNALALIILISWFCLGVLRDAEAMILIFFIPIYASIYVISLTFWFCLFWAIHKAVERSTHAT